MAYQLISLVFVFVEIFGLFFHNKNTCVYHESHNCSLNYVWEEMKLTVSLCLLQVHTVGSQHA